MQPGTRLRASVVNAREQLARGREKLRRQHESGSPGIQVCAHLTDLLDTVVQDLYRAALAELGAADLETLVALVPHGGYGRRDVAPFSDVDLMLLYPAGAQQRVAPLARRLTQDVCDAGLTLGFSLRTAEEASSLALRDGTIFTSLAEARFLAGNAELFANLLHRFRRAARRRYRSLLALIDQARRDERRQYGETVYLLTPNIKRSPGGLRDLQLIRWIGFARFGESEPDNLVRSGALAQEDRRRLRAAREFLLQLRNELHFHAGKSQDVLLKDEQLRLAELYGFEGDAGQLPVEKFMRCYFEHTSEVRYAVAHFLATAQARRGLQKALGPLFSHQVEGDFRVGPVHISATGRGLEKLRGDPAQVLRLMDLANLYDKRIEHTTWQAIRESMLKRQELELSDETIRRFLSLLSQPAQLGELLRRLHELRVLERIVPGMAHARCLVQFNEYHKYTVDEHSIRAVQSATEFLNDPGPLGQVYRSIKHKRTLHLALLIHDLGKGFAEDHSEVGRRLAEKTAEQLRLPDREAQTLKFLVHKHLSMAHLALWRNIDDEALVVQFAVEVGSPEVLQMLYVLSCADLNAVGPGVLNQWKLTLLTDLYERAMSRLAGDAPGGSTSVRLKQRRDELRKHLRQLCDEAETRWWERQIQTVPPGYLLPGDAERLIEQLEQLRNLPSHDALAWGAFQEERHVVEFTVGTYEQITPGVFHKLTGALSSQGLQILSAEIHTLADGLVLDRFYVHDMDYSGEPPPERLASISQALVAALKDKSGKAPTFRRLWADRAAFSGPRAPTRVHVDNNTSELYTILDIFAHDRMGLLYTIARTLFELELNIHVAKIGTYVDQVVDVFYVTDSRGRKVHDEQRLQMIRGRLLAAIES